MQPSMRASGGFGMKIESLKKNGDVWIISAASIRQWWTAPLEGLDSSQVTFKAI